MAIKGVTLEKRILALVLIAAMTVLFAAQGLGAITASAETGEPVTLIGADAEWAYEGADAGYLSSSFTVQDIADISGLNAHMSFEAGYTMYLNGHEIDHFGGDAAAEDAKAAVDAADSAGGKVITREVDLTAARQYLISGENNIVIVLNGAYDSNVGNDGADDSNVGNDAANGYATDSAASTADSAASTAGSNVGNAAESWAMTLTAVYEVSAAALAADDDTSPEQVNVHVGGDAATEVNFTYTTIGQAESTVTLTDGVNTFTFTGENSVGAANKYFHKIAVTGLSPATTYNYIIGAAPNTFEGKFKTAPAQGNKDSFKFVYLADTQVANADNAKALGATLDEVAKMNPDFVYLAGDITDTATAEDQWEGMFRNAGAYPTGGREMFGNFLIAAIQGNHDNSTFNRHINAPAQQGSVVYSFDYGPATFIMLNLESARSSASARAEQKTFLTDAVNEAKARGQWVAVGFHKSLYTGASHITDSDVIEARTYWCPIFAQLDVDFVLQGHDHVYSRGFVAEDGTKGVDAPKGSTVVDPENVPLYMIGGHAGGLKWYSLKNYTISPGDPLIPGYAFLDVDSANPAHNDNGIASDVKREQVIVELNVSVDKVLINCYMFKYDEATDTITTEKYLYDSLTVLKAQTTGAAAASISGPSSVNAKSGAEIKYVVSYSGIENANAFDTEIKYDSNALEFVRAESIPETAIVSEVDEKAGAVRIITGLSSVISDDGSGRDIAAFVFKVKSGAKIGQTAVTISRANTVNAEFDENGAIVGATDINADISGGETKTDIIEMAAPGDANNDGRYTLADLSIALGHYQSTDPASLVRFDMNNDGVVNTADYIMIAVLIRG
ncbi:MAG: metallophosphoesterase [Clostridiales Family XIII bacterium]|nr:metallophosphoesterase [Clostridiales Family XIII bacterium]